MAHFEIVNKFKDSEIDLMPRRATKYSAGYDMVAAEDITIPSYKHIVGQIGSFLTPKTLQDTAEFLKKHNAKPTLISTGVKCKMEGNQYLKLVSRSSMPLKHWIICANSEGIIDADYYGNEANDGEIFFQCINFAPWPIKIKAGEKICQAILCRYELMDEDCADEARHGGFGSTNE